MSSISNSKNAFEVLKSHFNADVEEFWALFLDHQLQMTKCTLLNRGTVDRCDVHPRDLFREALRANAHTIIIAHNHTSRVLLPSSADILLTKKFKRIGQLIQIPILDHILFSDEHYYSFKEHNLI